MTLQDLIERLKADKKLLGNIDVLSFKIVDANSTREWYRVDKDGNKTKLKDFLKEMKAKIVEGKK